MKPLASSHPSSPRSFFRPALLALCLQALLAAPGLHAATYYWDTNNSTAGFGTAGGTWAAPTTNDATQGWTTDSAGISVLSGTTTTTTSDALNFGTAANQLGTGTITVSGNVSANTITIVGSSSNITLSGGNITLNAGLTATNSANTTAITETISSNITLGESQTWTVNNGGSTGTANLAVSGVVSGTSLGITKEGTGTLTLSGSNAYTGGTTVNSGSLILTGGTGRIKGALTVNGSGVAQYSVNSNNYLWGSVSSLTLSNGGTFIDGAIGTYLQLTPSVTFNNGGTLSSAAGANGSGEYGNFAFVSGITVSGTGLATIDAAGVSFFTPQTITVADTVSGSGVDLEISSRIRSERSSGQTLTKAGAGTLLLSGNNTSLANWSISAGTLEIGATGRLMTGNYNGTISNSGYFIYSGTNAQTLSGVISGTGALTQNASSVLTLSGNNTYSGATTINAGTIEIGAAGQLGGGSYAGNIANNGTLIYSGTNAQTLSGVISGTGALTQNNSSSTLTLSGDNTYSGTTTISAGILRATHSNALGSTAGGTTVASGAALELSGGISIGTETLSLSGTGISSGGGLRNISGDNSYAGLITLGAASSINSDANTLTLSGGITGSQSLTFGGAGDTTVSGNITTGAGGITKDGNGTLTISGAANSWNGTTYTSAGTLNLSGDLTTTGQIVTGISTSASVLNITGNLVSTRSTSNPRDFSIANAANRNGTVNLSGSGYLEVNGGMMLAEDSGGYGVFNQTGGTFTTNGTGSVWLGGQSSTLDVSGGTFDSSIMFLGSGATYGSNTTVSVSGTGSIAVNGILYFGIASRNATAITVNLGDGSTGGNLSINAVGYAAGASAGPSTINFNGGTLTANATFSMITQATTMVKAGGAVINVAPTRTFTISNNLTTDGGGGGLTKEGAGGLLLSGNNTYTGATTINTGTLEIGAAGRLGGGTYAGNIANSATMIYSGTSAQTLSGVISGTGGLTHNASSALTLSGNNTYSGATAINAGTLEIGAAGRLGAGTYAQNITNNGTLLYSGTSAQMLSGVMSGAGALTKSSASTLTLTGNNTYTGATTINAGTLAIDGTGRLGGGSYAGNIVMTGVLTYNSTADQTLSGQISGGGSLNKFASSTLTLSGSNTRSGSLFMGLNVGNLTAGAVKLGHNNAVGTGGIFWENDGTLELAADGLTVSNANNIYARASATDGKRRYLLDLAGSNTGTFSGIFDIRMSGLVFDTGTDDALGDLITSSRAGEPKEIRESASGKKTNILKPTDFSMGHKTIGANINAELLEKLIRVQLGIADKQILAEPPQQQ